MASSSSSSNASSKKPNIFRVDSNHNVYCGHNLLAMKRVAGVRSSREGAEFFGCPLWPKSDCKFFLWKDEYDRCLFGGVNSNLELEKQLLEYKVSNLEIEKALLVEENKNLKLKLSHFTFLLKSSLFFFSVIFCLAYSLMFK